MTGLLLIGEVEADAIRAAIARARKKPIPWTVLREFVTPNQQTDTVTLADRGKLPPRQRERVLLPLGYQLSITFEEQPAGLCMHLSMSSPRVGMLPNPVAFGVVLAATGIDLQATSGARAWIEDFLIDGKPGGKAFNVCLLVEPREAAQGRH
jgi:hypothetical protein